MGNENQQLKHSRGTELEENASRDARKKNNGELMLPLQKVIFSHSSNSNPSRFIEGSDSIYVIFYSRRLPRL